MCKFRGSCSIALATALLGSGLDGGPASRDRISFRIDRYIESELKDGRTPGISVAVFRKGEILLTKGYGVVSKATAAPMTENTLIDLASVSKSFSAIAVRQLQTFGEVQLDRPVRWYLPEFHLNHAKSASARITVRHLLEHTSGLTRQSDMLVPCCGTSDEFDLEYAIRSLQAARPLYDPGKQFSYANCNYVLLAAIVERVSGMKFPNYMEERVFLPLGMTRTTLHWDRARAWGLAEPHDDEGRQMPSSPRSFFGWYGSSMVRSTASDMALYLRSLLARGPEADAGVERWLSPGLERPYQWGWFVLPRSSSRPMLIVEHGGNLPGVNTAVVLAPDARAGVVVLINAGGDRARRIGREVLGQVLGVRLF